MNKITKKIKLILSMVLMLTLVSCTPRYDTSFYEGEYLGIADERYPQDIVIGDSVNLYVEQIKMVLEEISEEEYLSRRYVNPECDGLKLEDITDEYPEEKILYKNAIRNLYDDNCYEMIIYLKYKGEEEFIKYDISSYELGPGTGGKNSYEFYLYFKYGDMTEDITFRGSFNLWKNKENEIIYDLDMNYDSYKEDAWLKFDCYYQGGKEDENI